MVSTTNGAHCKRLYSEPVVLCVPSASSPARYWNWNAGVDNILKQYRWNTERALHTDSLSWLHFHTWAQLITNQQWGNAIDNHYRPSLHRGPQLLYCLGTLSVVICGWTTQTNVFCLEKLSRPKCAGTLGWTPAASRPCFLSTAVSVDSAGFVVAVYMLGSTAQCALYRLTNVRTWSIKIGGFVLLLIYNFEKSVQGFGMLGSRCIRDFSYGTQNIPSDSEWWQNYFDYELLKIR